jgi:hypothetical protein
MMMRMLLLFVAGESKLEVEVEEEMCRSDKRARGSRFADVDLFPRLVICSPSARTNRDTRRRTLRLSVVGSWSV